MTKDNPSSLDGMIERMEREAFGLTQTEASELIWCSLRAWQQWEAGDRRMHAAFWELFTTKLVTGYQESSGRR